VSQACRQGVVRGTLHRRSRRAAGPFVAVNCAALPDALVEAELFGVERGAFTGALQSRAGRFERAAGGTLFLDEIGSLPYAAQGKLLRVLQEREVERVGGLRTLKVDVRVIAATNVDLREEVKRGRFREDLFFRLNVFPIVIPPLRERRDDIALLIDGFLLQFCHEHSRTTPGLTPRAQRRTLLNYAFPGNIRELRNMVERGVIAVDNGEPIDLAHLFRHEPMPAAELYCVDGGMLRADRPGQFRTACLAAAAQGDRADAGLDRCGRDAHACRCACASWRQRLGGGTACRPHARAVRLPDQKAGRQSPSCLTCRFLALHVAFSFTRKQR
jgi:transcriptional regulator with GAF, ATPase, and Fis domain